MGWEGGGEGGREEEETEGVHANILGEFLLDMFGEAKTTVRKNKLASSQDKGTQQHRENGLPTQQHASLGPVWSVQAGHMEVFENSMTHLGVTAKQKLKNGKTQKSTHSTQLTTRTIALDKSAISKYAWTGSSDRMGILFRRTRSRTASKVPRNRGQTTGHLPQARHSPTCTAHAKKAWGHRMHVTCSAQHEGRKNSRIFKNSSLGGGGGGAGIIEAYLQRYGRN